MKILCDACDRVEASLFCPSDEAALCYACDRTIHHANKLSRKHSRFSLHHPSTNSSPLCDICQVESLRKRCDLQEIELQRAEKRTQEAMAMVAEESAKSKAAKELIKSLTAQERRACLFCREDRAILCRECDVPIHTASEHTRKHNRFLLTGLKLSASISTNDVSQPNMKRSHRSSSSLSVSSENATSSSMAVKGSSLAASATGFGNMEDQGIISDATTSSVSTSSISEYLIEMIPGYCFEDLLDASSSFPLLNGFSKKNENLSAFEEQDIEASMHAFV